MNTRSDRPHPRAINFSINIGVDPQQFQDSWHERQQLWDSTASRCEAELCPSWTGDGCICRVLDLDLRRLPRSRGSLLRRWWRWGRGGR